MNELQRSVLVSASFNEKGQELAESVEEFLGLFELCCVRGEVFGGDVISKGVRERIEAAWFVIALLSREVKSSDGVWRASEWVMQEVAWAKAYKKDCLILVEDGVCFTGGILGDIEYLKFGADSFSDALVPLGRQLRALLNHQLLTIGIRKMPVHTHVSNEPLQDECTVEARRLILEIRRLATQSRYEEALELAKKATKIDPQCWRAWTSLGALLVQLGNLEGEKIFDQVLNDFPGDNKATATAWHNRAWVHEIKGGYNPSEQVLQAQSRLYENSLELDESRVNTRACLLIIKYLLGEKDKAEQLLEESLLYEGFLDALRHEFDKRGASAHKVLLALPTWLRHLLYPGCRSPSGGCDN